MDHILDERGMSQRRYYRYLKHLLDYDYIRIEKTRANSHRFNKNVYTLVTLPNPEIVPEYIVEETR